MPVTKKGAKIKKAMIKLYGKKRGTQVFYASANKGIIEGVIDRRFKRTRRSKHEH